MAIHPVLDQYPQWRAYADLHGLSCSDDAWLGWKRRYTIICAKGHASSKHLHYWTKTSQPCGQCADAERLARLHAAAAAIGARCLDEQWRGTKAHYRFCCQRGHEWSRPWAKCFAYMRCSTCTHEVSRQAKMRPDGLVALRQVARDRGGVCLAQTYFGLNARYAFRCAQGHRWDVSGSDALRGHWCRTCSNQAKTVNYRLANGLDRLRAVAEAKGGVCLSTSYAGAKEKYLFRCAQSHEWLGLGAGVLRGGWCFTCANDAKRLSLADAQAAAAARGGQCLSEAYVSCAIKMHWMCDRGHTWLATLSTIRAGHWCRQCANLNLISNRRSKAAQKYLASFHHE